MDNIKIYVAAHQRFVLPSDIDLNIYIPIHCGKATYNLDSDRGKTGSKSILPEIGDDTGDNISKKNKYYSELTAMYWIWKNDTTSDIVGLNHYRRFFAENDDDTLLLSKDTILTNLKEYDCMVSSICYNNKNVFDNEHSVYHEYGRHHNLQDMNKVLIVCSQLFPDIFPVFLEELTCSTIIHYCNLLICSKKIFDEYCSFIFSILFKVEKMIDFDDPFYDSYQMRVCGFLAERMLRPWLIYKGYTFKSQPIL